MPHKHKRREKDLSTYDLPPSQVAKPLPVTSISKRNVAESKDKARPNNKNLKRKRRDAETDDAPRAFKRLMAFAGGMKPRSGLDDGTVPRKAKKTANQPDSDTKVTEKVTVPTIRPGESMSEFAARVNTALPLTGLVGKSTVNDKDLPNVKVWRTKKERKMHKLYDEWREEDRRIKEKREEELELAEERGMEEDEGLGVSWRMDMENEAAKGGKSKKGKKGRFVGEATTLEEDPWEEIKRKRGEARVGLHDVAAAPPILKPPKPIFTVRGATVDVKDIPKAAGSLRRREELREVRDEVVASYRKMMARRRPGANTHDK